MKVKWLIGALVVLMVMNIAAIGSFLFMHHSSRAWHHDRDRREDRAAAGAMPREERKEITDAVRSFREEVQPIFDETRALEKDLLVSMSKDPVPRAHIDSVLVQISKNRLEISRRATDRMLSMGDSLSPTEREQMIRSLRRLRDAGERDGRQRDD